jgi:hypothetical protein
VEAYLVDSVGDVGVGEHQVLGGLERLQN